MYLYDIVTSLSSNPNIVNHHIQNKISRLSELPKPMGRKDHRFLSPEFVNPRKQV